ncbi:uncharacterized protein Pbp45 [Fopius arisanus]|uniref:Uncharacterized protein Pbp45 n=1 Tax=Fopius arisanus TaxID=64838 RepID=A0A9R1T8Z9_9HYME|nr:PREDICTED: uncharacterized protein LOC105268091 [Fopius arisanus]
MMEDIESEESVKAPGFREDCLRLLEKFEENEDCSFERFSELWRMMKFTNVYWNRVSEAEMLQFCKEALDIAKEFISPSCSITRKIGGIFLLYGLYFKCPMKGLKIRKTKTQWENLLQLRDDLFSRQKMEAVYILNKLIESHAFAFCIRNHENGLENHCALKDVTMKTLESSHSKPTEILSSLTEISSISEAYVQLKSKLLGNSTGNVPKLYNGLEIKKLLKDIDKINDVGSRRSRGTSNDNEDLINDSSSTGSEDTDEDFDPDPV